MTLTMDHCVELQKQSQRRLNSTKIEAQIQKMKNRALGSNRGNKGWNIEIENKKNLHTPMELRGQYTYKCKMRITCSNVRRSEIALRTDYDNIIKFISSSGATHDWSIASIDDKPINEKTKDERIIKQVGYVAIDIADDWEEEFKHIYDRENQIEIIMSAINAGIDSNFNNRFHCALVGDPASGKTETLRAVKRIIGEDGVLEYDATATTQAGVIQDLNERDELPRILIVEEIEKTDPDSLRWLLGVLDHRGEIRKTTVRGKIEKETKLLALATVNDYPLFLKAMYGALASRFSYHLHFPQPDKYLLQRILEREVEKINGKKAWIQPALEYAMEEKIYDPRKLTAICLCGRDQLLGKKLYQEKLRRCAASNFLQIISDRKKITET